MAQKPRPSGTIRTPNYPRLSSLAIAAALSACNGEVKIPTDGDGAQQTAGGGASSTIMGSTAGIAEAPYGGQGGATSIKETTAVVTTGGIGNPAGDIALPFGGTTSIAPEATGGAPEMGNPAGKMSPPFGGTTSIAPEATGGVPEMGNPAGKMSPPYGGSGPIAPETTGGSPPVDTSASGGVSPQTTATMGGRSGTGGSKIASAGGTSVQTFTTTSAPSSGTSR